MDKVSKKQFKDMYRAQMKITMVYCCLCGRPIDREKDLTLEHQTPKYRGGADNISNWGIAHAECNSRKGALTMEEWFQWLALERKRYGHAR